MNLHGGIALIRSTWLSWMQHRSFFFLLAFGWMIPPLIYLFVWSTAAGGETIGGLTQDEFIAYYILLIVVNQLTYSQTNWTVGDEIRYGGMNAWLLRPMWPIFQTLSTEFAGKIRRMFQGSESSQGDIRGVNPKGIEFLHLDKTKGIFLKYAFPICSVC